MNIGEKLEVTRTVTGYYCVRMGDRYTSPLTWDEAIATVVAIMVPKEVHGRGHGLHTTAEHFQRWPWDMPHDWINPDKEIEFRRRACLLLTERSAA